MNENKYLKRNYLNWWIYFVYKWVGLWFIQVLWLNKHVWCCGLHVEYLGSLEPVLKCLKLVEVTLLLWHLAARDELPSFKGNQGSY